MKTADFIREHRACEQGADWALSISDEMTDVWDDLVKQRNCERLLWTATRPGVFPDSTLRRLACRFVRETPVGNGRTVWDLLTDERSRKAVEVAEAYADGKATEAELDAASDAAYAATDADLAADADYFAAYAAYAADAAAEAVYSAYYADGAADAARAAAEAAKSAQIKMIAELGNPFKKGSDK